MVYLSTTYLLAYTVPPQPTSSESKYDDEVVHNHKLSLECSAELFLQSEGHVCECSVCCGGPMW